MRFSLLSQYVPMNLETGQFIGLCWGIFVVVWLIAAFFTKRTAERSASFWRLVWIAAVVALVGTVGGRDGGSVLARLPEGWDWTWAYTSSIGFAADAIVGIGLLITLWARFTLGANWSGSVTFKENHELVMRGPYAFVRHPIYTGLLTMLLGTVIISGHALGFAILTLGAIMLWLKSLDEERMMTKHFPDTYPPYKRRVAALIPFIL